MENDNVRNESEITLLEQSAREHLIDFSILTNPKYRANWHHREIARELEAIADGSFAASGKRILILQVPPRHGKSEEATINFPAWLLGSAPHKQIITASYSSDLAVIFGSKTRDLVDSDKYRQIFPNVQLKPDDKAKARWNTNKGGSYASVGVGGAITGFGADVFIIDDPIKNREEADSQVMRDKHWDWFTSTVWTRLESDLETNNKGVLILILTRWHLDDLAGRILAEPSYASITRLISFPAIATHDDKFRIKGEALWANKYDIADLEQTKKLVGIYQFSSLYQQSPILTDNQEFKPEWYRYRTRQEVESKNTRKFLTVDTAFSKKNSADYCGFCENYVDQENFWNLAAYRMRLDPYEFINFLFTIQEKRNFEAIGIEETSFVEGIQPYLEEEQRKRGKFLPIVLLKHNQINKETRIRGLIPRYSSKSVYHIIGECTSLEEEFATFPQSVHDDTMDATQYQNKIAEAPLGADERIKQQTNRQKNVRDQSYS